jgi:hypothetical protein
MKTRTIIEIREEARAARAVIVAAARVEEREEI